MLLLKIKTISFLLVKSDFWTKSRILSFVILNKITPQAQLHVAYGKKGGGKGVGKFEREKEKENSLYIAHGNSSNIFFLHNPNSEILL